MAKPKGKKTRKSYSPEEKARILAAIEGDTSGRKLGDRLKAHGIYPASYYLWRKELGNGARPTSKKGVGHTLVANGATEEAIMQSIASSITELVHMRATAMAKDKLRAMVEAQA